MSYIGCAEPTLGFSLKPPKWLRKLQPGKVLIPAAAIAATLLIPGVAPAAGAALKAAGGLAAKGAGLLFRGGKGLVRALEPTATSAATQAAQSIISPGSTSAAPAPAPTQAETSPTPPGSYAPAPSGAPISTYGGGGGGGTPSDFTGPLAPGQAPSQAGFPVVPAMIGLAALMLFSSRRRA